MAAAATAAAAAAAAAAAVPGNLPPVRFVAPPPPPRAAFGRGGLANVLPITTSITFNDLLEDRGHAVSFKCGAITLSATLPDEAVRMPARKPYMVLVVGEPGTGKTYTIHRWIEQCVGQRNVYGGAEYHIPPEYFATKGDVWLTPIKKTHVKKWDTAMRVFGADILYASTKASFPAVRAFNAASGFIFDEVWCARAVGDWEQTTNNVSPHVVPPNEMKHGQKAAVPKKQKAAQRDAADEPAAKRLHVDRGNGDDIPETPPPQRTAAAAAAATEHESDAEADAEVAEATKSDADADGDDTAVSAESPAAE